ncbi:fungal specific transcription factor factor [Fusarium pseudoanthophilum]|uniref:Fungal specific transcription factor factor n=1 Tax=Fusarium pseudoanthophilum TaxID=48495 RepID=A0A8H5NZL6_9HYPO|nr:fungal specific transcription factor factor [Fusarium pseudoanthophilum]
MTTLVASLCLQFQQVPCKSSAAALLLTKSNQCDRCAVTGDIRVPTVYAQRITVHIHLGTSPRKDDNVYSSQRNRKSLSEKKIDDIAQKLAELSNALGAGQSSTQGSVPAPTASTQPFQIASPSPGDDVGGELLTPGLEHEGESSLSAQAAFANEFIENAIINKSNGIDITAEMSSVLQSLRRSLGRDSGQQEMDYLYPHARALESGLALRKVPMPPIDKAFICLRMAKENPRIRFFWDNEATSFTDIFLKVYSPGDVTHAELITVNAGLYWLFRQCRQIIKDSYQKDDLQAQALICRDNLETVLANLPFHQPCNIATASSMMISSIYCLETYKPSAAWDFIATASHLSQTLGLHSKATMALDAPDLKVIKTRIFWLVYIQEKGLSLRLGRSSTIRDTDITIPVPSIEARPNIGCFGQLDKMRELASLQGKIYDQLYSPAALAQPQSIRVTRARGLASELEVHANSVGSSDKLYLDAMRQATSGEFVKAFVCTTKVLHLSLFCLIFRVIPAETSQGLCLAEWQSVVATLQHEFLDTYVYLALIHSPFVPFVVVFCHIIETCDRNGLELLESVIMTLQPTRSSAFSSGARKEFHLFKSLYDAARKYLEARLSIGHGTWQNASSFTYVPQQPALLTPILNSQTSTSASLAGAAEYMPHQCEAAVGMDTDIHQYGAQPGNWLHMNNQMTRALEDGYFWDDLA